MWLRYPFGPTKNQTTNPMTGRNSMKRIHKTFLPVDAVLLIILTIAQIAIIRKTSPKMPLISNPMMRHLTEDCVLIEVADICFC